MAVIEILAHVAASLSHRNDEQARSLARGYAEFQPKRRINLGAVHGNDEQLENDSLSDVLVPQSDVKGKKRLRDSPSETPLVKARRRPESARTSSVVKETPLAATTLPRFQTSQAHTRPEDVAAGERSNVEELDWSSSFEQLSVSEQSLRTGAGAGRRPISDSLRTETSSFDSSESQFGRLVREEDLAAAKLAASSQSEDVNIGVNSFSDDSLSSLPRADPSSSSRAKSQYESAQDKESFHTCQNEVAERAGPDETAHLERHAIAAPALTSTIEPTSALNARATELQGSTDPHIVTNTLLHTYELLAPQPAPSSQQSSQNFSHVTATLQHLANNLRLRHVYSPSRVTRTIAPRERGYWLVDVRQWDTRLRLDCWATLQRFICGGGAGWGVSCFRIAAVDAEECASPIVGEASDANDSEDARWVLHLYCFGEVVKHTYLLLYLASKSKIRRLCSDVVWRDADGVPVVFVPG